jgi:hypothetical protein
MGRIVEYRSQVRESGQIQQRQSSGVSAADGMGAFARGISNVGEAVYEIDKRKEEYRASKDAVIANQEFMAYFNSKKEEYQKRVLDPANAGAGSADDEKFVDSIQTEFDKFKEKRLEGYTYADVSEKFGTQLDNLKGRYLEDAINTQKATLGKREVIALTGIGDKHDNLLRSDPSQLERIVQDESKLINDNPFLPADKKAEYLQQRVAKMHDTALDSIATGLATKPNASVGEVNRAIEQMKKADGQWVGKASDRGFDAALTKLQSLRENLMEKEKSLAALDFQDSMKQIEVTGIDNGKYTESFIRSRWSGIEAERMVKQQHQSRAIGVSMAADKGKADTDIASELRAAKEKLGTSTDFGKDYDVYQSRVQAFTQRLQKFEKDPVGYTLEASPVASDVYKKFASNPTPQNARMFADTVIAEQKRLSPSSIPSIMSAEQVGQVAAQMSAIGRDEKGAAQGVETLQTLQATWGQHWPIVARDLRNGKALNDSQYIAASMLDKPHLKYVAEDLMRASTLKDEDLSKQAGVPIKDAEAEAMAALQPLARSLNGSADKDSILQAHVAALTKLTLYKKAWGGNESTDDLARKIVLDGYNFSDTFRVPANRDIRSIENGASAIKGQLEKMDFTALPIDINGLRAGDVKRRYIDNLKSFGSFVTNGDETGLRFVDQHGRSVMVKKDGKEQPLAFTWDELKTYGYDAGIASLEKRSVKAGSPY